MTSNFVGKLSTTSAGYSSGVDLGIFTWKEVWREPVTPLGWPDVPPSEQEFTTDEGASLEITITGETGPTVTSWSGVASWKASIQAFITGMQYDESQSRYLAIYNGDGVWPINNTSSPIHVIIESFEPEIEAGSSPSCKYTLKCYQQVSY
ncbi:MAG: hypothetical protein A4E31_00405 [Methanomassiliicoccales archaeon PtaU1.Bin030]|nr:MAG: hypothetical protein A4E31_00405 [Methanomassiliicoccales archaeon PtaU1.Bin030]